MAQAADLLGLVVRLQGDFWDALLELELTLDVEIDASRDLSNWDVQSLYEGLADDCGPASRVGLISGG